MKTSVAIRPALCAAARGCVWCHLVGSLSGHLLAAAMCGAWLAAALFLASPAYAAPERIAKGGIEYVIDRPADWVVPAEMPIEEDQSVQSAAPMRHRLIDYQVSLLSGTLQRYLHHGLAVLTPAAVERAGNIPIRFNPESEQLTVHSLAIIRAGKRIDKLHTARLEVLRRETGREQNLYDGVVTADFFLDDVRAGDSVDIAYTISGSNAVLGEKFSDTVPLASVEPIDDLRVRMLFLRSRPLYYSVLAADITPSVSGEGDRRELLVKRAHVPAIDLEPLTPVDEAPIARMRVTEYASWAEVSDWADRVYRVPEDLSPALREVIRDLRATSKGDADAVRRALRFVQTQIRYVGIEIGEGSFRPTHPNLVLERRYGDCKDKAVLLAAIVRALGLKAQPALVSTSLGRNARDVTPMPRVFDHMIVMTEVGGERYWLDATRTLQQGTLDRIGNPYLHWALVTGQASAALTPVTHAKSHEQKIHVGYRFTVHDYREPVSLTVTETYSGILAESLRRFTTREEQEKLLEQTTKQLMRSYPGATQIGRLVVDDDTERNALTLTVNYTLPQFIEARAGRGVGHVFAAAIQEFAEPPVKLARLASLALAYPMSVQTDFDVEFPEEVALHASRPIAIADDNIEFAVKDSYGNKRLHIEYAINTRRAAVPAKEVKAFADTLRQIRERAAYYFPVPNPSSSVGLRDPRAGVRDQSSGDDTVAVVAALDRERETKVRTLSEDIGSGRLQGRELAESLVDRAVAYSSLDRPDEGLADLGRALEVDPNHARAYVVRGEIYSYVGKQERALADFARALQLDAKSDLFMSRGRAYFYQGDYRAAQADFNRVAEQESKEQQLHALIWLYFATRRLGGDASAEIAGVRSRADLSQWPGPIVMLLLGQATPEEALSGAWSFDRKTELLQRCEAYFSLGEYRLLAADREAARAAFGESFATGVKHYVEYSYSRLELKRLQADVDAKRAKK